MSSLGRRFPHVAGKGISDFLRVPQRRSDPRPESSLGLLRFFACLTELHPSPPPPAPDHGRESSFGGKSCTTFARWTKVDRRSGKLVVEGIGGVRCFKFAVNRKATVPGDGIKPNPDASARSPFLQPGEVNAVFYIAGGGRRGTLSGGNRRRPKTLASRS